MRGISIVFVVFPLMLQRCSCVPATLSTLCGEASYGGGRLGLPNFPFKKL